MGVDGWPDPEATSNQSSTPRDHELLTAAPDRQTDADLDCRLEGTRPWAVFALRRVRWCVVACPLVRAMVTPSSVRSLLDRDAVFGRLTPESRREIARHAVSRWASLGNEIWCVGEAVRDIWLVQSGVVAVTAVGHSGYSVAVEFGGGGDCVGAAGAFCLARFETTAFALTPRAVLSVVPREIVRLAFEANAPAGVAFAGAIAAQIAASQSVLQGLSLELEVRMANLFVDLSGKFGGCHLPDGWVTLAMPLSRSDVARMVSASTESVIRVLSRWRSLGYIRCSTSGGDILDMSSIRRLAHDAIVTARWTSSTCSLNCSA